MTIDREDGLFWLRDGNGWTVGSWNERYQTWSLPGHDDLWREDQFAEVGPRLHPPGNSPALEEILNAELARQAENCIGWWQDGKYDGWIEIDELAAAVAALP